MENDTVPDNSFPEETKGYTPLADLEVSKFENNKIVGYCNYLKR